MSCSSASVCTACNVAPANTYYSPYTDGCNLCSTGCTACSSASVCTGCADGYALLSSSTSCTPCTGANVATCTNNGTTETVVTCATTFYLDTDTNDC